VFQAPPLPCIKHQAEPPHIRSAGGSTRAVPVTFQLFYCCSAAQPALAAAGTVEGASHHVVVLYGMLPAVPGSDMYSSTSAGTHSDAICGACQPAASEVSGGITRAACRHPACIIRVKFGPHCQSMMHVCLVCDDSARSYNQRSGSTCKCTLSCCAPQCMRAQTACGRLFCPGGPTLCTSRRAESGWCAGVL
jgi:hypothetical protein